jgi:hypothetical protein
MTRRRSLKRRIRARMKRTGESYTTARRQVVNRLEAEPHPTEVTAGARSGRRPIWIAAIGLALVGAAVAAVILAAGGDGSNDGADRFAGLWPCSEVMTPAQLAHDPPERCFRRHGGGPTARGVIPVAAAIQSQCDRAPASIPKERCALVLRSLRQAQPPRSRWHVGS